MLLLFFFFFFIDWYMGLWGARGVSFLVVVVGFNSLLLAC